MPYRACKSLLASNELSKRHTQSKESKAALRVPKDGDLRSENISLGGISLGVLPLADPICQLIDVFQCFTKTFQLFESNL